GTDQVYYESAAHALAIEPSGGHPWGCATCRNKFTDRATPLESRFYHETARASFRNRISREKANEICIKLLEKYEENIPIDNYGKTIQEVYDMDKIVPRQEYLDQFKRMKEELVELGVEYPY